MEQSQELLEESLSVARASGIEIHDSEMQDLLIEVVESTSENRCSMLQDLMAGRKTEIDSLWIYHYDGGRARNTYSP